MPRLPDYTSLDTASPQSSRGIASYDATQVGKAMQGVGSAISSTGEVTKKYANEKIDQQGKLEGAYAESALLQSQVEIGSSFDNDPDYTTYGRRYQEKSSNAVMQAASMITNPEQRSIFQAKAQVISAKGFVDITGKAKTQEASYGRTSVMELVDKNKEAALSTSDEEAQKGLIGSTHDAIDSAVAKGWLTPEVGYKAKRDFTKDYALSRIEALAPKEQVKMMMPASNKDGSTPTGGFDSSVNWVLGQEGGYVSNDGGKGPTNLGINSAANPEVDVKSLTPETAKAVYKTKYWDAIGADSLPADLAMVAFDGAVNQGVGKSRQMLKESGGDASKLIEIRRREYNELATKNPEKYGKYLDTWNGRLDDLQTQISSGGATESGNPLLQYIPFEKRQEIIRKNQGALRSELVERIKDDVSMAQSGQANPEPITREDFYLAYGASDGAVNYDQYLTQQQLGKNIYSVSSMTPAEQNALIESSIPKAGANFAQEQHNHELLTKAVLQANEQRVKDPMAFAQSYDMADVEPLDFNDDKNMSAVLADRIGTAQMMADEYGTPVKVLTNNEAKNLSTLLNSSDTKTKIAMLGKLRTNITDDAAYLGVVQQIRADSPVTAMAGAYLGLKTTLDNGDGNVFTPSHVAEKLLQGEALLNPTSADKKEDGTNKRFTMPSDKELRATFDGIVGDSFRGQPQSADQAYQAYRAYYAAESSSAGDFTGVINADIADIATKAVVGNITKINGKNVIPPWGVSEHNFTDAAEHQFSKIMPGFANWEDASITNTGEQGKYLINMGQGYMVDKSGKPIILDVSADKVNEFLTAKKERNAKRKQIADQVTTDELVD